MKCLGPHIPMCAASEARVAGPSRCMNYVDAARVVGGYTSPRVRKRAMVDPQSPFFVRLLATNDA